MAITGNVRKRSPSPTLNSTININITNSEINSPMRTSKSSRSSVSPTPGNSPAGDGPFPENVLEKNKIVDGVFSEEAESEMDGDESFSFSLLNGKPQIKISPKVVEEVRHQWKNSLIVKLLGKAIKCDALCNKACALWNLRGGFKALDLGENYFLFTFESMEDRMRVYTEGPWVVMDHFLSICKWEPNFKPSEGRRILRAAVWVRFLELPVVFRHDKILYHVAKSLGRPIKVDHSAQGKFARVCIEINLSKPLCPVIEVEGKDCTVEYESMHPDKNKFAGVTDAFKSTGEAQRVLLDCGTRSLHDAKLKNWRPNQRPQQQANINPNIRTQTWAQNPKQQQPQKPTFWTMCPHCVVKYQYYRDVINKSLSCQRCKKIFIGHEIKDQPTVRPTPFSFKPNDGVKVGSQGNASFVPRTKEPVSKARTSEVRRDTKPEPKLTAKVNGKRKKRIDESESSDYKENLSDDEDLASGSKKAKSSGSFRSDEDSALEKEVPNTNKSEGSSIPIEENGSEKENDDLGEPENGGELNVEADGGTSKGSIGGTDSEIYDYPDPDFNDFDKNSGVDCFAVGQTWALYDTAGGMPRFYARVGRILSKSAFKLKITWLEPEPDPDDENECKWVDAGLPVSCGNFKGGDTETCEDRLMFSHQIDWEKGSKKDTYKIYPRKGETWALFKNWDMNWHSNPKSSRKYEFEFVEILSDYHEDNGVTVTYLSKIKGFSCLFCRVACGGTDSFQIPYSQLFRFSHRIPCVRLSGEERDDVPKDSFELDPASLPSKMEEINIPKDPKAEVEAVIISEEDSPEYEVKDEMESDSEGNSNSSEESPETCEIPEPDFFNFDAEISPEKFQPGQFWALYSEEDGLPKYYAFINKVDHEPEFKLHVTWLIGCPTKNTLKYANKHLPVGCGMFMQDKGDTLSYTDTSTFSHRLIVEPTSKMDEFAIYPRKGDVWAVYKNWKSGMTPSDLKDCEYDILEILEESEFSIKGVVLEMVSGHNSVFKAKRTNVSLVTIQIDRTYLLKFSHQIPAFRLTDKKGGSLKGFWELDPAALPIQMFCSRRRQQGG